MAHRACAATITPCAAAHCHHPQCMMWRQAPSPSQSPSQAPRFMRRYGVSFNRLLAQAPHPGQAVPRTAARICFCRFAWACIPPLQRATHTSTHARSTRSASKAASGPPRLHPLAVQVTQQQCACTACSTTPHSVLPCALAASLAGGRPVRQDHLPYQDRAH